MAARVFWSWLWTAWLSLISLAAYAGQASQGGISVTACGDVMMQNVDAGKSLTDAGLSEFMSAMRPWMQASDIGFVNLEGPIGGSEPKGCSGPNCYRFQQGPATAKALRAAGVTIASLANNHANDMGASGQAATKKELDGEGILYAGHRDAPSARWIQNGLSVELLAMTANGFAPDFRSPGALGAVSKAKARSDIVILSLHMGCEGERCARIPGGPEIFLGEDRGDPKAFARAAVDAGADLVLGSGPHVPRALDLHRGRLIAYSLGNCAAGPGLSVAGKAGLAPALRVRLSKDGALSGWDVGSFIGDGRSLRWDPKEGALAWMVQATKLDAPAKAYAELMELREVTPGLRP